MTFDGVAEFLDLQCSDSVNIAVGVFSNNVFAMKYSFECFDVLLLMITMVIKLLLRCNVHAMTCKLFWRNGMPMLMISLPYG